MIEIRRLNMDSSWQIRWQDISMIIDPWLIGSEVDGFRWFNEQWHNTEPVPMSDISERHLVIVSQPYTDHCHAATLMALHPFGGMAAVKPAAKRISRETGIKDIAVLPDASEAWFRIGEIEIARMSPDRWIDPIYHALLIRHGDDVIYYAPHGFVLTENQHKLIKVYNVKLLITTFSYYKIPDILGGLVNPGYNAAQKLMEQISPEKVINTHDEQKTGKGLIPRIAQSSYPDMRAYSIIDSRIIDLPDYRWLRI